MERSILDPGAPRPELSSVRWRFATTLWVAGAVLLVYSLAIGSTGGIDFTFAGVRLRSRSWQRPALLAFLCLAVVTAIDRRHAWRTAGRISSRVWLGWTATVATITPSAIAAVAAGWTIVAGVAFGTFVAGGADSSGYLNQARLFAQGHVVESSRVPDRLPWREDGYKVVPLGYRPAADRTYLAPTYPPGYPLLMAAAFLVDARVAYLIVPLSGMLAVWITFALGRRLRLPCAGAAAALLLAVSPTFLYQLVQPMSDVPVTAAWLLALYLSRGATISSAALSGTAAGLAVLIRPNLLPLAGIICLACAMSDANERWRRAVAALAPIVPALAVLGLIQSTRYGSSFASGYGAFHDLFGLTNVWPNLERYPRWMFETHTPLIGFVVVAPLWLARRGKDRWFLLLLWAFAIAVVAAYLPYVYFQTFEWTYTRFLLPAIPIMWLLLAAPFDLLGDRMNPKTRATAAVLLVLLLAAYCLYVAKTRYAFELRAGERKYLQAAEYVRDALPSNGLLICMQHSGSLWFYTPQPILRWDYLDPRELADVLTWATDRGYAPYLIVDREEYDQIRERFRTRARPALDRLRPLAQFGEATIYGFE
jgi:hypothetical protein